MTAVLLTPCITGWLMLPFLLSILFLMVSAFSCGTRDNVTACGPTDNILIISPISYGWETRSSWLRQGVLRLGLLRDNTGVLIAYDSGDGSLSVMDVRSRKQEPIAHSEDQEDELLSIVAIKGCVQYCITFRLSFSFMSDMFGSCRGTKAVAGTQLGVLSIFNRNKGWGDCVDRVPGYVYFRTELGTLFSRN